MTTKKLQINLDEDMALLWDTIAALPAHKHITHAGILSRVMVLALADIIDRATVSNHHALDGMFKCESGKLWVNTLDDDATKMAGSALYEWLPMRLMTDYPMRAQQLNQINT